MTAQANHGSERQILVLLGEHLGRETGGILPPVFCVFSVVCTQHPTPTPTPLFLCIIKASQSNITFLL